MTSDGSTPPGPLVAPPRSGTGPHASGRLAALAASLDRPTITLGEVIDRMGQAGFGLVLLIITLVVLIPLPGPLGILLGGLIVFISAQLFTGARRLWLPDMIRRRQIPAGALQRYIGRALPWLERAEAWLRPRRWIPLSGRGARVLLAVPLVSLGAAITLPIPLGNFMPALALIVFALGLIARDGLAILIGLVLTAVALGWTAVLVFAGAEVYQAISGWLF